MYKIGFYVPESHLEQVKQAMFVAGAGKIGHYEQCSWQVKGLGQFKPMPGSHAFIGEVGKVETLEEYRVEMVCETDKIQQVIIALKQAHPYETPAYDVVKIEIFE
ncbi:NGG1p interacting factor NIF3 [Galenea microaerophila]